MTAYPPPPPADARPISTPRVAWLVPIAGVLAIVGAILPWFEPIGYAHGRHGSLGITSHAWQGGAIGVLAPVVLIVIGVLVLRLLVSSRPAKPGKNPVRRYGVLAIVFALLALLFQLFARGLILHADVSVNGKTYHLDDLAGRAGLSAISRGTQIGFWITAAAAVIALVGGIAMLVVGRKKDAAPVAAPAVPPAAEVPPATTVQ
jgi:hypothetical protein